MITMLNHDSHNWDKYNVLFEKAWTDLKKEDKLDEIDAANKDKTAFADLAHYFAYINDLIKINPLYVMLPIDEAPFEINANTRTIKVPGDFAKCSGVQSDNYAEIVTFTIDRYFDYKDLSQAQIAVQWVNESANPKVEGVSFIELIDLETYGAENKIRFGWPLTAEMTAAAGNLRFAVRFFTTSTDENNKIAFNYIFNTTVASIPIKSTLNIDFNSDNIIKKTNDLELFTSYITNSANPSYGIPTPVVFTENLEQKAAIDLNTNTLTLMASARTQDKNPIVYEWYRINGDEIEEIKTTDNVYTIIAADYIKYEPLVWPKNYPNLDFWVAADEGEGLAYKPFKGEWPTSQTDLFVRRTVLKFEDNEDPNVDITGIYYVRAINDNTKNSVYTDSAQCKLLAPETVKILEDLLSHQFLKDDNTISLTIDSDGGKPQRTYKLFKKNDSWEEGDEEETKWNEVTSLTVEDTYADKVEFNLSNENAGFGQYYITVDSKLNRKTESKTSNVCVIYDEPLIPSGDIKVFNYNYDATDEEDKIGEQKTSENDTTYIVDTEENSVMFDATVVGTTYMLQALVNEPGTGEATIYNTGHLTYKWECAIQDGPGYIPVEAPTDLGAGNIATDKINGNSLIVRVVNTVGDETRPVYTYKCTVTNPIEEKSASKDFIFRIR